jgi:hypothetical protein
MVDYKEVPSSLKTVINQNSGHDIDLAPPEKIFENFKYNENVELKNPQELIDNEFATQEELDSANLSTPEELFGKEFATTEMKLTSPDQLFNKKQKGNLAKKLAEKTNKKPLK